MPRKILVWTADGGKGESGSGRLSPYHLANGAPVAGTHNYGNRNDERRTKHWLMRTQECSYAKFTVREEKQKKRRNSFPGAFDALWFKTES